MRRLHVFALILLLLNIITIILGKPLSRYKRQVVQPTWLLTKGGMQNLFVDSKVRVNPQNLKEAAAIRASIQKAVQDGTYAVQLPNSNSNGSQNRAASDEQKLEPPTEELPIDETTTPTRQGPTFIPIWGIQFPQPASFDAEAHQNFMRDMQRAWWDVVTFTRQMFTWS